MCLFWRSPITRSPESTSGDFIFNPVIADSGMLEIGTRQLNNWRLHEPPDFLPFCQPGALSTRLYCSLMPRHHFRLSGRYKNRYSKICDTLKNSKFLTFPYLRVCVLRVCKRTNNEWKSEWEGEMVQRWEGVLVHNVEIAKSLWLIKVYGIGFCLYWFQIIFCNKCNPCTLWNKFRFCFCWDWLCVLEGIKISNLSVGVLAKKSVCLEVFKVTFLVVV